MLNKNEDSNLTLKDKIIEFAFYSKMTVFFFVGILVFFTSFFLVFHTMNYNGGESMYAFFYIYMNLFSIILITIDRILVSFFEPKVLSKYELITFVIFLLLLPFIF